jgi:hypothetical protein
MENPPKSYQFFSELPLRQVKITDAYWGTRQQINQNNALLYQWDQLEHVGTIDNFRIVGKLTEGKRRGEFYSDSDAYKWAEAAAISLNISEHPQIEQILRDFIVILEKAQDKDGYLYTFNQIHFPTHKWENLLIEHELYCLGHLIEAGIAHYEATTDQSLLELAKKAANIVVLRFVKLLPEDTPGHQEIELALLRLYRLTRNPDYLALAQQFIEQRGQQKHFGWNLLRQNTNHSHKIKKISQTEFPGQGSPTSIKEYGYGETLQKVEPPLIWARAAWSFLSGKYMQQQTSIRKMKKVTGHAVRFGYFVTAASMLFEEIGDPSLLDTLTTLWDHMVNRQMYVTGGIGSLPVIEGFGRDWELPNNFAYCETCAAIANIFWSWEMSLITGKAQYADLIEWQLYNAAAVGIALDGQSYLYRNPLESTGELARRAWFRTACCPSNISRLWGKIGQYIYFSTTNAIWVHQYIGNHTKFSFQDKSGVVPSVIEISMESGFPWEGECTLHLTMDRTRDFTLFLRIPGWVSQFELYLNQELYKQEKNPNFKDSNRFGGGFSPYASYYTNIHRTWQKGDIVSIKFSMDILIRKADQRVKADRGKITLSRGPIVYCIESNDNPKIQIQNLRLDLQQPLSYHFSKKLLGGIGILRGFDSDSHPLLLIPYYAWSNRGKSQMQVWHTFQN